MNTVEKIELMEEDVPPRMAEEQRIQDDVPWGIRIAAAWSWRVIMILAFIGVLIWLLSHVSLLIIPLLVAALLATLLRPLHNLFVKIRFPRVLAAISSLLVLIGLVAGLLWLVGQQLFTGFAEMATQVQEGLFELVTVAEETAAGFGVEISTDQINQGLEEGLTYVQDNSEAILGGAMSIGSTAGNILVGLVLALFTLVFFLADGRKIWDFMVFFAPGKHRPAIHGAGRRGWTALGSYMRIQVFVAAVDAVGIGVGAAILGVPLALPVAVLVFLGSFIPVVGAVVTGFVAILLALVANGLVNALFMVGVVLLVQQIESNILQPIVMGKAVKLHPLAVILAVTAGTTLLGIVGALFAVPVLAFVNRAAQYLVKEEWRSDPEAKAMERLEKEEAIKRAAEKEVQEAEEQASLANITRRLKETIPGLNPDRRAFARRGGAAAGTVTRTETQTDSTTQTGSSPRSDPQAPGESGPARSSRTQTSGSSGGETTIAGDDHPRPEDEGRRE
ncbi:AI-2E family transporter [Nesterenkonia lutea]|uniref:PurR-regulated permease PerM n=1 Tax=Nesterenkonia lutea TaxID=272919 RepID=A0ABR9JBK2_9MICC|nr:AI-2E family transporter [Nesterenkonia lutea]MBE1523311.1 putative PurR-regulated permease PerM [Nesterenkonia lutea]